jgi:hypothetical protein
LESQRKNKIPSNRANFKESKLPIDYINYDIDREIDNELSSPDKMRKNTTKFSCRDVASDGEFKAVTKKFSQSVIKNECQNLLVYSLSNNQIILKDDFSNNFNIDKINENFIKQQNKQKNAPEKLTEMKIIVTEEDNKTKKIINFESNSFKKPKKQSPVVTKYIKEFDSKIFNKTNSLNFSPDVKNLKRSSSSFKLTNGNNLIKPKNFFQNFENEIEKHKKELYRFNSGKLFCKLEKEQIFEKIHRKQLKMNEVERKRELSRKKVNFNLSHTNLKQCNSMDLSLIKNHNSNTSKLNINGISNKNSESKICKKSTKIYFI